MRSWGSLVRFVVLALVWGSSFVWIKVALGGLSPVQISLARLGLGALLIVGLCVATRTALPRDRKVWLHLLVPAFFGNALPFTLFGLGEQSVDSGVAGVINGTTALWTFAIALVIRSERRPSALRVGGLLIGFAGVIVIFAPWHAAGLASWGALACLVAAISYGVSNNYIGKKLAGKVPPTPMAAAQVTLGAVLVALATPVGGWTPVHLSAGPLIALGVLGLAGTGIAFVLNNRLIADEGPTVAASVGYLIPVVSVLLGAIALHEPLSARVLVGMVVVLAGVALSRNRRRTVAAAAVPALLTPGAGR